ncbi:MAG: GNAT family N-acetyltransferase [Armatimonadota bacterium]|nr:GNAT family N-acetyltransferase [Armatimonadota bacterium]MDR7486480.1 GNAT family N-acetyltransferase [Armatimonadota bacterium]MDR7532246.1 GNAT family N-acetyltransferase [Armatimonadota bacterium]MDR7537179.1 GNAT family N-acetyltransferase [Armatimonadota bacterium]
MLFGSAAVHRYALAPGLGAFAQYAPGWDAAVRESLGRMLAAGGVVHAALSQTTVVGYLGIAPAGTDQPWGRLRDPRIQEVVVEVARGYRGRGLAHALLRRAFTRPEAESRIYVATGYAWCWDLKGTGLDAAAYASRLLRLFEAYGFAREPTVEPNIAGEPVNFLAVRVGRLVPPAVVGRFRRACRGLAVA